MDYVPLLRKAIRDEKLLFGTNYGRFYPIEQGTLLAKVFLAPFSQGEATKEYANLSFLQTLDERIRVPTPHALINIGPISLPGAHPFYSLETEPLFAVVMEWIYGRDIASLPKDVRQQYLPSVKDLFAAFLEHELFFDDLKPDHLLCMEGSDTVCLVDTHLMFRGLPRFREHYAISPSRYYARQLENLVSREES